MLSHCKLADMILFHIGVGGMSCVYVTAYEIGCLRCTHLDPGRTASTPGKLLAIFQVTYA